jgi:receptor protein-tyrosine kinase
MTMRFRPRAHLVERAVEALNAPPPPRPAPVAPPAAIPPAATPAAPVAAAPVAAAPVAAAGLASQARPAGAAKKVAAPPAGNPIFARTAVAPAIVPPPPAEPLAGLPAGPVLGLDRLAAAGLQAVPGAGMRSRVVKEFALVQQQVLRGIEDGTARNRVVLVTSALPREGKSFIALNLAASMANAGARVVLVDADPARGSISDTLGVTDAPGLRGLAAAPQERPATLLLPTAIGSLLVLPYGMPAQGLPPSPAMARAVAGLAQSLHDHVLVLDTPPSLSTSDASALCGLAGQVVMVVDAESTHREEVEAALDMVKACPLVRLLLNRARPMAQDGPGAHDAGTRHSL